MKEMDKLSEHLEKFTLLRINIANLELNFEKICLN